MKPLPEQLLDSLVGVPGFNKAGFEAVHRSAGQRVSIRYNPVKLEAFGAEPPIMPGMRKIPWSTDGYYLPARPAFTLDPLLHAGIYYVQEASSMFLEQALAQTTDLSKPLRVLDLCAAPGGKSTLIQSLISDDSLLVSNEVIKTRVNVLEENLTKWGGANVIVVNNDPRDFSRLEGYFDVLVVDAPCSGSGLFRRDPAAIDEWSSEAVNVCSQRQQRILADAYPCLKNGGVLIYSTCSYSQQEDEDIADWLAEEFNMSTLPLEIPVEWNVVETRSRKSASYGYRFFPDRVEGEGFFLACFRKEDGANEYTGARKKNRLLKVSKTETEIVRPWLRDASASSLFYHGDEVFVLPYGLEQDLMIIHGNLYTKKAGVRAGKLLKDELLPDHELAVSVIVSEKVPVVSLKKDEALQYLRKEEVTISGGAKGWCLAQYERFNLGWVKLLANRVNNYYPREWRILKSGNK